MKKLKHLIRRCLKRLSAKPKEPVKLYTLVELARRDLGGNAKVIADILATNNEILLTMQEVQNEFIQKSFDEERGEVCAGAGSH